MIFRGRTDDTSRTASRAPAPPPAPSAIPPRPAAPPAPVSNEFAVVLGQTGMGKTAYLLGAYLAAVRNGRDCTLIDSKREYAHVGTVVRSPREWAAHALAARRAGRPFNLVVQPGRRALPDDWGDVWALMFEAGNLLVAIDEADLWAPAGKQNVHRELQTLISWGRSRRVDIIATVRLYSEVSELLRANAHTVVTFRQPDQYYARIVNERYFRAVGAEVLMRLPKFVYLRVDTATGRITRGRTSPPPSHGP